jgi:hypothetical protein
VLKDFATENGLHNDTLRTGGGVLAAYATADANSKQLILACRTQAAALTG